MPDRLVGAELADCLAVLDHVGDHHDILTALGRGFDIAVLARHLDLGGGDRRPVQFAELPAEAQQIVVSEALTAEAQHQMLRPGRLDRGDCLGSERAGEVDPFDVSAERRPG